ncbi:HK97 family phage prohead protease [Rhodobacteraceae bacterium 2376]|uniref:HK97 family phage prohead protease n=1 Tax=Rhabdonatronobacter sediminivivens TaxID=2743469 RepID=A0A7Z0KZ88_9RHOB|nr:HK97 family phage prohead protease [Rhabdonatronobacter sediminivivens]NYS26452.1 HK97 family phage prohead protease [Rhabdonatronobacter sediminivivens]
MKNMTQYADLEHKFHKPEAGLTLVDGTGVEGYASLFGVRDRGGDRVMAGAYAASLSRLAASGGRVRMLWQHDPAQPIGIWDEVAEDARGLWVKGRLLTGVARAREAAALIASGALDGLSIGYRTIRAERDPEGGRKLVELDLWEVSLVTFPMLPVARVATKSRDSVQSAALSAVFRDAASTLSAIRQRR